MKTGMMRQLSRQKLLECDRFTKTSIFKYVGLYLTVNMAYLK